ncbi:semaphorin-4E isoform X2 [Oncorhynchus mykiss]|uniref:Semaphorin 4e n=1 Tax=Oncorhynchus mykiss TaxID=8022 RepID=A0A8K9WWT6_ONCMY|nr:semaphorin-4E isoform X1 [Oncorhynchus mykiss]XP_036842238.1 semaphorin-4E isoform X2 [Oncorhynchus mykiss]
MYPLVVVSFFWLLPLALTLDAHSPLDCVPRKTVPYHRENGRMFGEEGVWNYSTMLLREDLGLLLLGARENIYALDINNISNKKSSVSWKVTEKQQKECSSKGKNQIECQNYIRVLHTMEDGRMYVCGTKAFNPECDYMSYKDGELTLENKAEDGKGKCPFDPFQRFSSIMIDKTLYSATSMNFLGSEPVVMRSSPSSIRTEFKSSWLHEPNFISMAQMPESRNSLTGDDDKVYLFFTETAVEYDFYSKLVVSRVARVCKGDLGGQRTLQKKWTSFLKARVDCPVLESQLPYIIQDTYRWCEEGDWRSCVFYAVFTSQSDRVDLSAVCAYRVLDIGRVFSEGKYKTPVTVETSFVKWVMYSGAVPSPRPGACIDDEARNQGISQTLDLPDRTLQFIRDRPLMDQAVLPMGERPLLVRRGTAFTRIIVHRTQALDGKKYHVMFIGTEVGSVLKALNYDKEMFIIEEVQLFQPREPIKVLRFSNTTGQLYAGSEYGAVQMPFSSCGRSRTCVDCVLARDPYCVWDRTTAQCISLSTANTDSELIQSLWVGDFSLCPTSDPVKTVNQTMWLGGNVKLQCPPTSNLAETHWVKDSLPLPSSHRNQILRDSLLILNASASDTGRYRCLSLERSHSGKYTTTVAEYQLRVGLEGLSLRPEARTEGPSLAVLQVSVAFLAILLAVLLGWNLYKGHLPLPGPCGRVIGAGRGQNQGAPEEGAAHIAVAHLEVSEPGEAESKALVSGEGNCTSNNNHSTGEVALGGDEEGEGEARVTFPSLQFIDDESEI